MFKHILIPTDGSQLSEQAATAAIRMAKALGSRVTVLHVVPEPNGGGLDAWTHDDKQFAAHLGKVLASRGNEYLETLCDLARGAGVACDCALVHGESAHAEILVEARSRGCDLIVMASHGRRGISAIVLGSETVKVLTHSAIPVLVVRAPHQTFFAGLASLT